MTDLVCDACSAVVDPDDDAAANAWMDDGLCVRCRLDLAEPAEEEATAAGSFLI